MLTCTKHRYTSTTDNQVLYNVSGLSTVCVCVCVCTVGRQPEGGDSSTREEAETVYF